MPAAWTTKEKSFNNSMGWETRYCNRKQWADSHD